METLKIVENIQRICKEKGTTPTVACKESGAGKDLVTNMKRKGTRPSIERIRLLAEYLGVTTGEILGETDRTGPGDKKAPATGSGDGQAEKLAKVLKDIGINVDKLSEDQLRLIAKLAKAALEE